MGLIPRVLKYIFNAPIREEACPVVEDFVKNGIRWTPGELLKQSNVKISYLEIYNDHVFDLLEDKQIVKQNTRLKRSHSVKENALKGVYVENLNEIIADSAVEAYEIFLKGLAKKRVHSTVKNPESSRSHTVF
jgi:hypothetical protein